MKGLTDIPGILVGHASDYDGLTGCTVMLCEAGAVAGGDRVALVHRSSLPVPADATSMTRTPIARPGRITGP